MIPRRRHGGRLILDVLEGIVYDNDRQVSQAEITHVRIDAPFVFVGASKIVVSAV